MLHVKNWNQVNTDEFPASLKLKKKSLIKPLLFDVEHMCKTNAYRIINTKSSPINSPNVTDLKI